MERILLDNLAVNQSFDAALRHTPGVDTIVGRFTDAIMFQTNDAVRKHALGQVENLLIDHFSQVVQPAARKIGINNAKRILSTLGPGDLNDPALRQKILIDSGLRSNDRVRIVQAIVNDKANTLDNRLASYWLEPGAKTGDKLAQLRDLHKQMEAKRVEYDKALRSFEQGKSENRPRKPNLDFESRFKEDVRQGFREQARRAGTDTETAKFIEAGHSELVWITVNATDACPDCRKRQGARGDVAFWDALGRPGSGKTVCGSSCFCMLVPVETLSKSPNLNQGLVSRIGGVYTTPEDEALLSASRQ